MKQKSSHQPEDELHKSDKGGTEDEKTIFILHCIIHLSAQRISDVDTPSNG
jgi:hypothetical protein